jgi:hypothetical protein
LYENRSGLVQNPPDVSFSKNFQQKSIRILTKRLVQNPPDISVTKTSSKRPRDIVFTPLNEPFSGVGHNWFNQVEMLNPKFINQRKTKPSLIPIFGRVRTSNKRSDRSPTYVVFVRDKQKTLMPPVRLVFYNTVRHVYCKI